MKILVTANQKGGVGKTAVIVHLAFDFVERGLKVAVVDLDAQANTSYTLGKFSDERTASQLFSNETQLVTAPSQSGLTLFKSNPDLLRLETLPLNVANSRFQSSLHQLVEQQFDVCLIDTAPFVGVGMMTALYASNYVMSPIQLEAYSIRGIERLLTTISRVRKPVQGLVANPALKFLGMLPSMVDSRKPRQIRNLRELQAAYSELLIPHTIGFRDGIADALASGVPVWQIKTTAARKAALEVRAVAQYIFDKMELS